MKFEKVALKKSWSTPVVRQIPLTDEVMRKLEEQNGSFKATRPRRAAGSR